MPLGVLMNVAAVALGGLLGSLLGDRLPDRLKDGLTTIFGVCALGMGVSSVVLMEQMPAVIFSVIVGGAIGILLDLDGRIRSGTGKVLGKLNLRVGGDPQLLVTAIVLFCSSGTGIYGSLTSGMTGDHSILIAKSILDLFTAMIFACQLKKATMLIAIPQLAIMLLLFFSAKLIFPLTNPTMVNDFKACGGILLLATGFTIMKVKAIPIANLIPAILLVMPVSGLWQAVIAPLL